MNFFDIYDNKALCRKKACVLSVNAAINALDGVLWAKYCKGVWNKYSEPVPADEVIPLIQNSGYGAVVYYVYNGKPLEDEENLLYAEVSIPCDSDMY